MSTVIAERVKLSTLIARSWLNLHLSHVVASLDKTLCDDYLCLVASNKKQIYVEVKRDSQSLKLGHLISGWGFLQNENATPAYSWVEDNYGSINQKTKWNRKPSSWLIFFNSKAILNSISTLQKICWCVVFHRWPSTCSTFCEKTGKLCFQYFIALCSYLFNSY